MVRRMFASRDTHVVSEGYCQIKTDTDYCGPRITTVCGVFLQSRSVQQWIILSKVYKEDKRRLSAIK